MDLTMVQLSIRLNPEFALASLKTHLDAARNQHADIHKVSRKSTSFNLEKTWEALMSLGRNNAWTHIIRCILRADIWREWQRRIRVHLKVGHNIQTTKKLTTHAMGPTLYPRMKTDDLVLRERVNAESQKGENWENLQRKFGSVVLAMITTRRDAMVVSLYQSQ
jgi:hypothetical protein